MHSSRMRTAHSSSPLLGGGGVASCMLGSIPLGVGLETPLARPPNFPPPVVDLETPLARPLNFPLGCGPGDPSPPVRPPNFPIGCGPGDSPGQTPQLPPWMSAWRHPLARPAKLPPGCGPGDPPPPGEQND